MAARNSTQIIGSMVLSVLVAFSLAWISVYFLQPKNGKMPLYAFLGLLFVGGIILILCSLICPGCPPRCSQTSTEETQDSTQAPELKADVITAIAKVGIIVFSFGATVYDIIISAANIECLKVYKNEDCDFKSHVTRVVYHFLKIIFMWLQIGFLFFENHKAKSGRTETKQFVFIYNSFVNFLVMIYTTMNAKGNHSMMTNFCPIRPNGTDMTDLTMTIASHEQQCLTYETGCFQAAKRSRPYLYAFHCEYSILAMTLNLMLWKQADNNSNEGESGRQMSPTTVSAPAPDNSTDDRNAQTHSESAPLIVNGEQSECNRCSKCLDPRVMKWFWLITFLGLGLILAHVVLTLLKERKTEQIIFNSHRAIKILLYIAMGVLSLLLLKKETKFPETLSVDSIVLILSAFVLFFFDFLGIIGTWYTHDDYRSGHLQDNFDGRNATVQCTFKKTQLDIALLFFDCVQVALQTSFAINIHWIMKQADFNYIISRSITMQCTSFLMAANLSQWAIGSFIIIHDVQYYCGPYLFYGEKTWDFVSDALYPFVLFYRFHCAIEFGEYTCMLRRHRVQDAKKGSGASAETPANEQEMQVQT